MVPFFGGATSGWAGILPSDNVKAETKDPDLLQRQKWRLIADKIERDPELLEIPLENVRRWSASRRDGIDMLEEWRRRIEAAQSDSAAFDRLLALLRSDDEPSLHLKSYSPFPGILTSEEVDRFTCAWRH